MYRSRDSGLKQTTNELEMLSAFRNSDLQTAGRVQTIWAEGEVVRFQINDLHIRSLKQEHTFCLQNINVSKDQTYC